MNIKTDIVKEVASHGTINLVVDRKTRKVLGKYTLGVNIAIEDFPEEEQLIVKLTMNGLDN